MHTGRIPLGASPGRDEGLERVLSPLARLS